MNFFFIHSEYIEIISLFMSAHTIPYALEGMNSEKKISFC